MGGAGHSSSASKSPSGVEVRRWKSGKETIRIRFYYRGIECRETLNLKVTKSNIKYAERLRAEILNRIARHDFSYAEYFPSSNNVARFKVNKAAPEKILIATLLDNYLFDVEQNCAWSTYIGYKKVCKKHLYPLFGEMVIQELKPAFLRDWIRTLNVKSKTVSNILLPIRAIVEHALNDDLIEADP